MFEFIGVVESIFIDLLQMICEEFEVQFNIDVQQNSLQDQQDQSRGRDDDVCMNI